MLASLGSGPPEALHPACVPCFDLARLKLRHSTVWWGRLFAWESGEGVAGCLHFSLPSISTGGWWWWWWRVWMSCPHVFRQVWDAAMGLWRHGVLYLLHPHVFDRRGLADLCGISDTIPS